jgi:NAD(P)-dependent dehydrogenase (short-subunit alcohol dehydrogenase family)
LPLRDGPLLTVAPSKDGQQVDARLINTSSSSGLYGNISQVNYRAAKAGIAAFTVIAAKELVRYGVTVDAIAPGGRSRMTESFRSYARGRRSGPLIRIRSRMGRHSWYR